MGYHNHVDLPVYDFLAKQFTICDRWFASLPTDTWPNRLYALTGGSGGLTTTPSDSDVERNPPGYLLKTIFEVLQGLGVDWIEFFSDLPFSLIFRTLAQDAEYTARMRTLVEFANLAKAGDLPSVTWIDPNYQDVPDGISKANDDHPPGDVCLSQQLIAGIYQTLSSSPAWTKTLLLITYDEHGGFYDHVTPPGTPSAPGAPPAPGGPPDDNPSLTRYGVRVPAFVVSPWAQPKYVSKETYDHTSILATILRRFCVGPAGSAPSMGARTDHASDVGSLLSADSPQAVASAPAIASCPNAPSAASTTPGSYAAILRKTHFKF